MKMNVKERNLNIPKGFIQKHCLTKNELAIYCGIGFEVWDNYEKEIKRSKIRYNSNVKDKNTMATAIKSLIDKGLIHRYKSSENKMVYRVEEQKCKHFAAIPQWFINQTNTKPGDFLLYAYLLSEQTTNTASYYTQRNLNQISKALNISSRQIKNTIQKLEKNGFLSVGREHMRVNTYYVTNPKTIINNLT